MTGNGTRWCELLVGLEGVEILDVVRGGGALVVTVESTDRFMGCSGCGSRARVKDRDRVELVDLPAFGQPVTLVWSKRRWRCPEAACGVGSWTEDRPDVAPLRSGMTRRGGGVGHGAGGPQRAFGLVGRRRAGRVVADGHGRGALLG